MLKGKEFGKAIGDAIELKLQNGSAPSKAAIARHFNMKPPSLSDWVKKGSVSKEKLPELWRYFSDVVGPEHWDLTQQEWPAGLAGKFPAAPLANEPEPAPYFKPTGLSKKAIAIATYYDKLPSLQQAEFAASLIQITLKLPVEKRTDLAKIISLFS